MGTRLRLAFVAPSIWCASLRAADCSNLGRVTREHASRVRDLVRTELRVRVDDLTYCDPASGAVVPYAIDESEFCVAVVAPSERALHALRARVGHLPFRRDGVWVIVRLSGDCAP